MREIPSSAITETVAKLCEQANLKLPCGMRECISGSIQREESELCRSVLGDIVSNIDCAAELGVPICQDTGMAVIFADIGQDVHITGDAFEDAVNAGSSPGLRQRKAPPVHRRRPARAQEHEQQHPGGDTHADRPRRQDPPDGGSEGIRKRKHVAAENVHSVRFQAGYR